MESIGRGHNFSWQQTNLRIKDPEVSLPFYTENFGMRLIHQYHFNESGFSLYFLDSNDGTALPKTPQEAEKKLWNHQGTVLELTHNHGTEKDSSFVINNGNEEPYRGFGHIAFNTDDVVEASMLLESKGVKFKKRPNEGKMKNIAFALDPDGYWIEIVNRSIPGVFAAPFNLSQTMIRIKDPKKSLAFYVDIMGMQLVRETHFDDFSLFFLANLPKGEDNPDPKSEEARNFVKSMWNPVLELTHNHGTEKDEKFRYHDGNEKPQGFGHIGFLCDDLEKACEKLENSGVSFKKKPKEGKMRNIAFIKDADGYSVELVQRGVSF